MKIKYKAVQLEEKIILRGWVLVPLTMDTEDENVFEGMLNTNDNYEESEVEIWDEYVVEIDEPEEGTIVDWDFVKKHRVGEE